MERLLTFLLKMPRWLRAPVAIGVIISIPLVLAMLFWVLWTTGVIQERLHLPTTQDLEHVKGAVQERTDEQLNAAIEFVVDKRRAHDSARYSAFFDTISTTLIEPGILQLKDLQRQVAHLNKATGINQTMLQEQGAVAYETQSKLGELQELMRADPTADQQAEILRQLQQLTQQVEEMGRKRKSRVDL